jgi:hypothetical protein
MSNEIAKASDAVCGGLIAGTKHTETAKATGRFLMECFDKDGNLKWSAEESNLVVNVGLQYMAGTALTSTAQITSWYIGLYGAGASNTPAAGDTMASHAGWTEVNPYSGTRPAATFAAATLANPSVVTNTASPASFAITSTQTVGGAFLTSNNTAGGSTGVLFSAADFQSPGDRSVVSGDTLNVTYSFSLAG